MIYRVITRFVPTSRTAMVVAAALAASPLLAIAADMPSSDTPVKAHKGSSAKATPIEARLESLHAALKITAAQEPKWKVVAEVMRDNAKTSGALIEQREANARSMTAIDDLRAYEGIAEAHVAGVKKLIPAVEALYAEMSDTQKKNADKVFSRRPMRSAAK